MNEKYIQALIVGGLIGAAIIISEFISQSNDDPMKFHAIKLDENSQVKMADKKIWITDNGEACLLYTSPSPRDISGSRMPSSA